MNQLLRLLATMVLLSASGCATTDCCCQCKKGPKTIFKWAAAEENEKAKKEDEKKQNGEKKEDDKSEDKDKEKKNGEQKTNGNDKNSNGGNGNGGNGEEESEERKPIESDRPDFTEASSTVGKGVIQLESGYTFTRDTANGVRTHQHSYSEALLRIGMFADWFEFRISQNFGAELNNAVGLQQTAKGADDLYLGTKLALTEQYKALPELALILQMTVPSGSRDLTANRVLPGVNLCFGWDVIKDCLTVGGSTQANRAVDDVQHSYVEFAQSLTVGYTLTKKLGAFTEWFALIPTGAIAPDFGPQQYFDGGFTYKVTDNFQLDISAGVGLNRHADNFFVGSGFSVRY